MRAVSEPLMSTLPTQRLYHTSVKHREAALQRQLPPGPAAVASPVLCCCTLPVHQDFKQSWASADSVTGEVGGWWVPADLDGREKCIAETQCHITPASDQYSCVLIGWLSVVLGIGLRVSHMLGTCSTPELQSQPLLILSCWLQGTIHLDFKNLLHLLGTQPRGRKGATQ